VLILNTGNFTLFMLSYYIVLSTYGIPEIDPPGCSTTIYAKVSLWRTDEAYHLLSLHAKHHIKLREGFAHSIFEGTQHWNSLPTDIKDSAKIEDFKDSYLLSK